MTLAELASMANGEGWLEGDISCDIHIYACTGYTHSTRYSLPIAPSPNLPSDASIALYPSLCFFEPTVVSIGSAHPTPFEMIGYPSTTLRKAISSLPSQLPAQPLIPNMKTYTARDNTLACSEKNGTLRVRDGTSATSSHTRTSFVTMTATSKDSLLHQDFSTSLRGYRPSSSCLRKRHSTQRCRSIMVE